MAAPVLSFTDHFFRFDNSIGQGLQTYNPFDPEEVRLTRVIFAFGISLNLLIEQTFDFLINNKIGEGQDESRSFNNQGWMYGQLEEQLSSRLGLDGHQCLLRFVCDLQSRPIQNWTLAGQVGSLVFTPKYGDPEGLRDYREATLIGRQDATACKTRYFRCGFSVFEYLEDFEDSEDEFEDDEDYLKKDGLRNRDDFYGSHSQVEDD